MKTAVFVQTQKATRAEASVMIVRLLNLKETDNTTNTTPDQSQTQQNQNTATETTAQTINQVSYQLTVSEISNSERNQLDETVCLCNIAASCAKSVTTGYYHFQTTTSKRK